jgi:hypothetical protein
VGVSRIECFQFVEQSVYNVDEEKEVQLLTIMKLNTRTDIDTFNDQFNYQNHAQVSDNDKNVAPNVT